MVPFFLKYDIFLQNLYVLRFRQKDLEIDRDVLWVWANKGKADQVNNSKFYDSMSNKYLFSDRKI